MKKVGQIYIIFGLYILGSTIAFKTYGVGLDMLPYGEDYNILGVVYVLSYILSGIFLIIGIIRFSLFLKEYIQNKKRCKKDEKDKENN